MEKFAARLFTELGATENTNILEWAPNLNVDGEKFLFENHEYQIGILNNFTPIEVHKKAAQIGLSTCVSLIKITHRMITRVYPKGVLILFPSRSDVGDFSRGRQGPFISENPDIKKYLDSTAGKVVDNVETKRINKSLLYMRGAKATQNIKGLKKTSSRLKSIPCDAVVFDERDEMADEMVVLAHSRLQHSQVGHTFHLSTPSVPEYGIDALYETTDRKKWLIKCKKCNTWTCLEDEFPNCLLEYKGSVLRVCKKCKNEIYPRDGGWVAEVPELSEEAAGFYISQLNSMAPACSPKIILKEYQNLNPVTCSEFYNSRLGQAYVDADSTLVESDIYKICKDYSMETSSGGPCYMGVDVNSRMFHIIITQTDSEYNAKVVYIGIKKDTSELYEIMKRYNVVRAVIDSGPETRLVNEFCRAFPGKVFGCHYSEHQKEDYKWDFKKYFVTVNRTLSLDTSHANVVSGKMVFPKRTEMIQTFAESCTKLKRRLHLGDDGAVRYYYVSTDKSKDHFRHALNYECIARNNAPRLLFGGLYDTNRKRRV